MPEVVDVRDRWIYHFTHADNIEAIFRCGYLACDVAARDGLTRTEVGDPAIKESRRQRPVLAGPGGQVGNYVPFYYAPRSPMMFRIACDHRDRKPDCYPGETGHSCTSSPRWELRLTASQAGWAPMATPPPPPLSSRRLAGTRRDGRLAAHGCRTVEQHGRGHGPAAQAPSGVPRSPAIGDAAAPVDRGS